MNFLWLGFNQFECNKCGLQLKSQVLVKYSEYTLHPIQFPFDTTIHHWKNYNLHKIASLVIGICYKMQVIMSLQLLCNKIFTLTYRALKNERKNGKTISQKDLM